MSVTLEPFGEQRVHPRAPRRCGFVVRLQGSRHPASKNTGCRGIRCHDGRMPAHVERAELPGIGVRHDIVTDGGRRLSVLNLRDGGRELALADEDDPDRASETIALTDDEATALSEVLGGSILTQLAGLSDQAAGLAIEQIPLRADSPFVGHPLGDTRARTRTRCSIVAIVREADILPAPGPADLLRSGDTIVAVGTRDGLDHLVRIIAGS
jgi:TrkA domain protein